MSESVLVAIITGGMAIIMTVINKFGDKKKITDAISCIAKGTKIGLENDKVIFKALREHNINGESEHQERKMEEYFLQSTTETFGRFCK